MQARRHSIRRGSEQQWALDTGPFRVSSVTFPPGLLLQSHYHARACFSVVVTGGIEKRFRSHTQESLPAAVVTMPPEERHVDVFAGAGTHMLVVEPDNAAGKDDFLAPCAAIWARIIAIRDARVLSLAQRLAAELRQPDSCTPLAVTGLVLEMLAMAARLQQFVQDTGQPPAWLIRAQAYLHDNMLRTFTIGDVATAAGVHPVYLAATFRRHYGRSPSGYLRHIRLQWVAEQLGDTDEPLSLLARRACFADQSHLTRRFKEAMGITPGQFRKQARYHTGRRGDPTGAAG